MIRYSIAEALVKILVPGWALVPPAYEEPGVEREVVSCGGGPERATGWIWDNPNWHYNRAANEIAIARFIEKREADIA
jgi:hypothetical protein